MEKDSAARINISEGIFRAFHGERYGLRIARFAGVENALRPWTPMLKGLHIHRTFGDI
jgi:hypothetical protein